MKKYADGGKTMSDAEKQVMQDMQAMKDEKDREKADKAYEQSLQHTQMSPKKPAKTMPVVKKAAGGYVKAADGCAKKGKTKGRMV